MKNGKRWLSFAFSAAISISITPFTITMMSGICSDAPVTVVIVDGETDMHLKAISYEMRLWEKDIMNHNEMNKHLNSQTNFTKITFTIGNTDTRRGRQTWDACYFPF